ncbi:hypothetical protein CCP3SC5AM1_350001 [Gammaproteobacteria bacterium]
MCKSWNIRLLTYSLFIAKMKLLKQIVGAIAQLGERLHGMQEVGGSIPPGSTISTKNRENPLALAMGRKA